MKRVNFNKITIKNFLSIGEEAVSVEFTKGLHVITGINKDKPERRNAIGKSTIADGIYFAIFGETLREIKKDLIINNVTGGKTQVELEFDVTTGTETKNYLVIRTLSPTKVTIYENNVDQTRDSAINTTKYICDVLSASPSIFKNCVIMTVNNATPFMAKNKIEKRKFIEDIFGLSVFSDMISQIRGDYNELKREYDNNQITLTEVDRSYNNFITQRDLALKKREDKKNLYLTRRENNITEKNKLQQAIDSITINNVEDLEQKIISYEDVLTKCDNKINSLNIEIATERQKIENIKELYTGIGTEKEKCPVCLRDIKDHDIAYIQEEKNKLKNDIEVLLQSIKERKGTLDTIINKKSKVQQKIKTLRQEINQSILAQQDKNNKLERIKQLDSWLEELEQDINAISNVNTDFDKVISEIKQQLDHTQEIIDKYKKELSKLDIVKYVVSEEGVKSYIVNKLLDLLNNKLIFYLHKLDSNSICVFNEYFEEEIINEKNKICSYFNFSGAERKAIDLACLFTFTDLRRLQGEVQYNISIYDELFDSSFDEKGIELITAILQERVEELNECCIVISHRKESIKAVTGDVIYLEKENGITRRIACDDI